MLNRAVLAMYPFAHLNRAYNELWSALQRRVSWLPPEVEQTGSPEASWLDPALALGMTCAWPLATDLRDQVRAVGSFHVVTPGAEDFRYRSVLVIRKGAPEPTTESHAAVNDVDSLSGHVSLLRYAGVGSWPGDVSVSGSHAQSLQMVAAGGADIASIDAVSFANLQVCEPALVDQTQIIGEGPLVPTLPLITSVNTSDAELAQLRAGLADVIADQTLSRALVALRIRGFSPLSLADYDAHHRPV